MGGRAMTAARALVALTAAGFVLAGCSTGTQAAPADNREAECSSDQPPSAEQCFGPVDPLAPAGPGVGEAVGEDPAAGEDAEATVADERLITSLRTWEDPYLAASVFPDDPAAAERVDMLRFVDGDELEATRLADDVCAMLRSGGNGATTVDELVQEVGRVIGDDAVPGEARAWLTGSLAIRCPELVAAAEGAGG
jgi:hypothetical protein